MTDAYSLANTHKHTFTSGSIAHTKVIPKSQLIPTCRYQEHGLQRRNILTFTVTTGFS